MNLRETRSSFVVNNILEQLFSLFGNYQLIVLHREKAVTLKKDVYIEMEITNISDMAIENADVTVNTVSTFENLPCTALQQNSKDTNIINAISQVLSIYHPNDGIVAYEHVIKTLFILSENLDNEIQQEIISRVPFPNGVPNDKIRHLIYKTSERVKAATNISTCQKIAIVPKEKFNIDVLNDKSESHLKQNVLIGMSQSFKLNEKFVPSIPEVFKGFPPNEISTIHSHLPVERVHNWNQCNISNISHMPCQDTTCLNKKLYRNNVMTNQQNEKYTLNLGATHNAKSLKTDINYRIFHAGDTNESFKMHNSNFNKSKSFNLEIQGYFGQDLRNEQQTIQQDIYKMDVVYCDEERKSTITNMQILKEDDFAVDNFVLHDKLQFSLQHFLQRAEQDVLIEIPILPQTKTLHKGPATSKSWKFINEKSLENNDRLYVPKNGTNYYQNISESENTKKFVKKIVPTSVHVYPKPNQLQLLHKNLNTAINKAQTIECEKKDNIENLLHKSAVKQTKQTDLNTLHQTTSITELATFKKQYYDTLLNIQKAKMAVANSLSMPTVESFSKYNPYYSNYSYRQQKLLEQHGAVNPQFTVHTMAQSGLSNVHNTPCTWMRYNNWRHPTMKQLRLPQQIPFHISRNKENSVLHYVKSMDIQCFVQDKNKQMKQNIQRKKLEDIVGKLKEVENNSLSD